MDPHFREYLAAVVCMQELYGFNDDPGDPIEIEVPQASVCESGQAFGEAVSAGIGG
jgi:hypothetical protein